jgi:hypothetical protein
MGDSRHTHVFLVDLPLQASIVARLEASGAFCLADLCGLTRGELATVRGIGTRTLGIIQAALASQGLSLKEDPDPFTRARDRNRESLRSAPRRHGPETPLEEIGLPAIVFHRCWIAGLRTAAEVSALGAPEIYYRFGKAHGRQLIEVVARAGLAVARDPALELLGT